MAEDLRFVVKTVVGEENFVDMTPNRSNNYCCGGGGGFLQSGFPEARRAYGKLKVEQIMATGATYAITPCHNCHAQIHDLSEHYKGGYHTVHLWTLICLAMGILGPNREDIPRRGPCRIADAGGQGGGRVSFPSTASPHNPKRQGRKIPTLPFFIQFAPRRVALSG